MGQQIYSQPSALGGIVEFAVEIALGATEGGDDVAIWQPDPEGALWDTKGVWSGVVPSWVDVTSRVAAVNTRRGRDRFEQQFRVGQCVVVLHNDDGIFTPDADRPPGAVALRPGRWLRVLGRRTDQVATPLVPGIVTFDGVADTPHVAASAFPIADLDAGFDITGTFRIGSGNLDQVRLVNAWTGTSGQRTFTLHWSLTGLVRFGLSSGGSAVNLDTDPIYPAGVEHTFHAVHRPGQQSTLTVDGDLYTSLVTVGTLDLNPEPLTVGTRSDLVEPRTNDWWVSDLRLVTVAGADARVAAQDTGNVPLDGVAWVDSFGTDWLGVGDVVASGFSPAITGHDWVPLWTGQIDAMEDLYQSAANAIDSRFTSLDFGARFQIDDPPALETPIPAGQLTSDRINQLLDEVNWPNEAFWRDIDDGENTMADSTLAQSRWAEMQVAATAEDGSFFISAGGVPTFKSRDWLVDKIGGPTKFTIGAVASDVKIMAASTDWSQQRVYGDVRMARKGGTEYRTVSEDSISLYGRRTLRRFDIECQTDNQLIAIADRRLGIAQFDRSRVESIDLVPLTAEGVTQLLNVTLGDLIRVTVQTRGEGNWAYTDDYFVNQVTHEISDEDWVTTLRIDAASFDVPLLPAAYTDGFDDGFDSQDPG